MHLFLKACLEQLNITADKSQLDKWMKFMALVLEANQRQNLTAITDEKEFVIKHIADSLSASVAIASGPARIMDVGAGAGFPSVPLCILYPEKTFTILDATQKKAAFIRRVLEELEIENAVAVSGRAEELGRAAQWREQFDYALARAVAPMPVLAELCLPFVKVNGCFIALKGADEDAEAVPYEKLGGRFEECTELTLPESDYQRRIVVVRKVKQTSKAYPRLYAQIKRQPI